MIKTIPKQERHLMYCIMLAEAEENLDRWVNNGFCWMAWLLFGISIFYSHGVCELFPELASKKPKSAGDYWYDCTPKGWQKRIDILKECIAETA